MSSGLLQGFVSDSGRADGLLDIFACSTSVPTGLLLFTNTGNGLAFSANIFPGDRTFVDTADIDRDGDIDLIVGHPGSFRMYTNNGKGVYSVYFQDRIDNRSKIRRSYTAYS